MAMRSPGRTRLSTHASSSASPAGSGCVAVAPGPTAPATHRVLLVESRAKLASLVMP